MREFCTCLRRPHHFYYSCLRCRRCDYAAPSSAPGVFARAICCPVAVPPRPPIRARDIMPRDADADVHTTPCAMLCAAQRVIIRYRQAFVCSIRDSDNAPSTPPGFCVYATRHALMSDTFCYEQPYRYRCACKRAQQRYPVTPANSVTEAIASVDAHGESAMRENDAPARCVKARRGVARARGGAARVRQAVRVRNRREEACRCGGGAARKCAAADMRVKHMIPAQNDLEDVCLPR